MFKEVKLSGTGNNNMAEEIKRLYRSRTDRTVLGICGGLAKYTNTDPVLFRVVFVILLAVTGFAPFGLAYLLAYFVMPLEPETPQQPDGTGR